MLWTSLNLRVLGRIGAISAFAVLAGVSITLASQNSSSQQDLTHVLDSSAQSDEVRPETVGFSQTLEPVPGAQKDVEETHDAATSMTQGSSPTELASLPMHGHPELIGAPRSEILSVSERASHAVSDDAKTVYDRITVVQRKLGRILLQDPSDEDLRKIAPLLRGTDTYVLHSNNYNDDT